MSDIGASTPNIVSEGWLAYGDKRQLARVDEISAAVSTNRVYRLHLDDGTRVVAKVSSYGSYAHFRQDHQRIAHWTRLLRGSRFDDFLAPVLCRGDEPFLYREGPSWMALYAEVPSRQRLPRVLSEQEITSLGRELASFHAACTALAGDLSPTWKTLGSDIAQLREQLEHPWWCEARGIGNVSAEFLREHCDAFLLNADDFGYHNWTRIPLLVDWNTGNFSIDARPDGFRFFTRWDYDWFRIEPRTLDFYFMSRVVSEIGDRTEFTYGSGPLLEPRFRHFLAAYHEVNPLRPDELVFMKEAYRFFLLNYVVREGEHFFRPEVCETLRRDVIERHLPELAEADFSPLMDVIAAAPTPARVPREARAEDRRRSERPRDGLDLAESFFEIASRYRVVFFDAFGVLKNSSGLLPGVPEALSRLREAGVDPYVLTNDASRSPELMARGYTDVTHGALFAIEQDRFTHWVRPFGCHALFYFLFLE